MRTKLFTLFGGLLVAGVLAAFWAGTHWEEARLEGEPTDLPLAILLAIVLIGLSAVYAAALGMTRRLEQLSASAEEAAFAPDLTEVKVSGSDELAAVARSMEKMRRDRVRGEEARNRLVADVAHELRMPLAILRGQLESLLEGKEQLAPDRLLPLNGRDVFQYYRYDAKAGSLLLIVLNFTRLSIKSDDLYIILNRDGIVEDVISSKRTDSLEFRFWPFKD